MLRTFCLLTAIIFVFKSESLPLDSTFSQQVLTELQAHIGEKYHQQTRTRRQAVKPSTCHLETVAVKLSDLDVYRNRSPMPLELKIPYCIGACIPSFAHDQRSQLIIRLAAGSGIGCVPNTETTPPPGNQTIFGFNPISGMFEKVEIQNLYITSCKCIG